MSLFVGASESYDTDAWEAYSLKKKNAKLQQQLADVTESMGRVEELEAENTKLRKAVEYLYGFAKTCGVDANDLRELGVEL